MDWKTLSTYEIKIYSTPWCSDCRRLKQKFQDQNITFTEIDIDSNPEAADYLVKKTGHRAIPYIEINEQWIVRGWHKEIPNRWDDQIFFSEVENSVQG